MPVTPHLDGHTPSVEVACMIDLLQQIPSSLRAPPSMGWSDWLPEGGVVQRERGERGGAKQPQPSRGAAARAALQRWMCAQLQECAWGPVHHAVPLLLQEYAQVSVKSPWAVSPLPFSHLSECLKGKDILQEQQQQQAKSQPAAAYNPFSVWRRMRSAREDESGGGAGGSRRRRGHRGQTEGAGSSASAPSSASCTGT